MVFEKGKKIKVTLPATVKKVLGDGKLLIHLDDGETILVWENECEEVSEKETSMLEEELMLREMGAE